MTHEKTSYRERTGWSVWITTIFWCAILTVLTPLLMGYDTDMTLTPRLMVAAGVLAISGVLWRVFAGLTVLVQETRLYVHLGSWPLIKRAVPYQEILELRSTEYRPFGDFGGWGVRGVGRKKAWTARGNQAVVLTLTDNRELYVGSDHPQRLEERIRTTAGDGLARAEGQPETTGS